MRRWLLDASQPDPHAVLHEPRPPPPTPGPLVLQAQRDAGVFGSLLFTISLPLVYIRANLRAGRFWSDSALLKLGCVLAPTEARVKVDGEG